MANLRELKVDFAEVFPFGVGMVGEVTRNNDFKASDKNNQVQARDKESGLPLWQFDVLDFDPQAREKTYRVKIAAAVQPVPPEALQGAPVRPVVLEGLTVSPYLQETTKRLMFSLRCAALVAPGRRSENKAA